MKEELLFEGNDLRLIESLKFDPELEPSYESIKGCLIWRDERPDGLSNAGYEALGDLWAARSFLHQGLDFSEHPLNPDYYRRVWERALAQGLKWPGFNRITLSEKDKDYLESRLREERVQVIQTEDGRKSARGHRI
jgi:hypothetical protein